MYLARLKFILRELNNYSVYYLNYLNGTLNNIKFGLKQNQINTHEILIYIFAVYGVISFLSNFRNKKLSIEVNLNDSLNEIRLRKRRRICYVDLDKEE